MVVQRNPGPLLQAVRPPASAAAAASARTLARTSVPRPGTSVGIAARAGSTPPSGAPEPTHGPEHAAATLPLLPPRSRSDAPLRSRAAEAGMHRPAGAAAAEGRALGVAYFDRAALALTSMQNEPKHCARPAGTADSAHRAALQARIARLQKMLTIRGAALQTQAELRVQFGMLDGHADPARYASWAEAAALDLNAVFQESQDALRSMQAHLGRTQAPAPVPAAGAASSGAADADSDIDEDAFVDAPTELAEAADSDEDMEVPAGRPHADAPRHTSTAALSPHPIRSLDAEGIVLDFHPDGSRTHQANGLALKRKIARLKALQAERAQFSEADAGRIDRTLRELQDRMRELDGYLAEKGIPGSLFFREPRPLDAIEAARERRRRDDQEALDAGHYTF